MPTVITNAGHVLVAKRLIDFLTHMGVGDGVGVADPVRTALYHEIGRTKWIERRFVVADPTGPIIIAGGVFREVPTPTNLIQFRFRFLAAQAQGNWTEWGLFGDGVTYIVRSALLLDGAQAGDDRANLQVFLGGTYAPAENQTITVTCTTGGGSGVARIGWVSTGTLPPASNQLVTFNAPLSIGASGVSLTFTGGADTVLTQNDVWQIRCTQDAETADFASGGPYDPLTNEAGRVATSGTLFRMDTTSPAQAKGAAVVDVALVVEVVNA